MPANDVQTAMQELDALIADLQRHNKRWLYALKIEGQAIKICFVGAVAIGVSAYVFGQPMLIPLVALWVACWFLGTAIWKRWYMRRK